MYRTEKVLQIISALDALQHEGVISLEQAVKSLHENENVAFDDIWLAVMQLKQLSEKEAMRQVKEWCRL